MNNNTVIKAEKGALKYAIVEMLFGDESSNVVTKGLFRGINEDRGNKFVILDMKIKGKQVFHILNPELYKVVSIEVYDGYAKTYLYFRAEDNDQRIAMKCLHSTLELMEHLAEGPDKNVIDTSKYTDVPKCMGINSASSPSIAKPSYSNASHRNHFHTGYSAYNNSVVKKKDPTPTVFSRRTKKPTEEMLKELRRKMKLIAKGKYEYDLPIAKGDIKDKEKSINAAGIEDNDYSYMNEMDY